MEFVICSSPSPTEVYKLHPFLLTSVLCFMYLWFLVLHIEEINSSFYQGVHFAGDLSVVISESSFLSSSLLLQCVHDSYVTCCSITVTHILHLGKEHVTETLISVNCTVISSAPPPLSFP
jgi:hypothetical protein